METAKKRFKPAAMGAATAVALVAGLLSVAPATVASAAPTDYTQPCAEPVALDGAAAQALYERVGQLDNDQLASELLCFSTAGSSAAPDGTLVATLRPIYAGTTISYPTVNWVTAGGETIGATAVPDSTGSWTFKLKLNEGDSGKTIHPEFSGVNAELPLQYETTVPDLWDDLCLAELEPTPGTETPTPEPTDGETTPAPTEGIDEPTTPAEVDKSICLIEPGHTELTNRVLQVWDTSFRGADQTVGYVPVKLGAVSISGEALVGSALRSRVGVDTKAKTVTYQWLRNGKGISKATGSSYKLVDDDRGARISLRVSASSPGQSTVVRDSNQIGAILGKLKSPNPRVSLKNGRISCPQWNCTAVAQSKVTADRGTKVQYQWYRDGRTIKGATGSTYTVKFKYKKGLKYTVKYTVKVTVSKAGYKTESQDSTSTPQAWVKLPK